MATPSIVASRWAIERQRSGKLKRFVALARSVANVQDA
jgi:hypothetical protein